MLRKLRVTLLIGATIGCLGLTGCEKEDEPELIIEETSEVNESIEELHIKTESTLKVEEESTEVYSEKSENIEGTSIADSEESVEKQTSVEETSTEVDTRTAEEIEEQAWLDSLDPSCEGGIYFINDEGKREKIIYDMYHNPLNFDWYDYEIKLESRATGVSEDVIRERKKQEINAEIEASFEEELARYNAQVEAANKSYEASITTEDAKDFVPNDK